MPDEWLHVGRTILACYLPFTMQSNSVDFTENKDILFRLQSLHSHFVTQTSWGCTGPNDLTSTSKGSYSLHQDETLDSAKVNQHDRLAAGWRTHVVSRPETRIISGVPEKGLQTKSMPVWLSICNGFSRHLILWSFTTVDLSPFQLKS